MPASAVHGSREFHVFTLHDYGFVLVTDASISSTPRRVWAGLAIAVLLDIPVQLTWKALMTKFGAPHRGPGNVHAVRVFRWFFWQLRTWELLSLFLCQFLNWLWVLGNADLSFAQPFTALSFVAVSGCAAFYFHEHISLLRAVGIGLILIGVVLVGGTEHRTTPVEIEPGLGT